MIKEIKKFQTTDGFRSAYSLNLPIISDTNTITNTYDYKFYTELYEKNISTVSFLLQAANSISNDDIKLTERLYIPQSRLRGLQIVKLDQKMEQTLLVEILFLLLIFHQRYHKF